MDEEIRYRGKTFTAREIDEINEVIATNRERSRLFISQEICRRWGWTKEQRLRNLCRVVINIRFLILPWVWVSHLASYLLGGIARRISHDWQKVYHHDVVWLETFVDPERGFEGTCYKAANWILCAIAH